MNELSVIKEAVDNYEVVKQGDGRGDQSEDSGLASSNNSSTYSGKCQNSPKRRLIIPFQALNAATPRESTFLMNKAGDNEVCDQSSIAPTQNKNTVISEDGKLKETHYFKLHLSSRFFRLIR